MAETLHRRYGPMALVTGASSGIGEAFVHQLAAEGFDLVLVARREERLQSLAAQMRERYNITAVVRAVDLGDPQALKGLVDEMAELEIGLLVSNAGFGLKGAFENDTPERLLAMIQTNVVATTLLCRGLMPAMLERGRGGVILTGSIEGETGFPWSSAYAATKAFVHNLGGGLWAECRDRGVDVLTLAPGSTDTDAPRLQGISDDQLLGVMSPERVAREALAQLGKKPMWIPGWYNRLFIRLLRLLPRATALIAAGKGMKSAIDNSAKA